MKFNLNKAAGLSLAVVSCVAIAGCAESSGATKRDQQAQEAQPSAQVQKKKQAQYSKAAPKLGEVVQTPGHADVDIPTRVTVKGTRSIPTIEERTVRADINRMNAEDFYALGLDKNIAEKVVQYRSQFGPFKGADELREVPGMNTDWLNRIEDRLGVS
jgi:DNA uptake protein ComE-like DNA-binding protein